MTRLCIFLGTTILGWVGWWLGERFGMTTAFLLSGFGSLIGVYAGWRIARDYFE